MHGFKRLKIVFNKYSMHSVQRSENFINVLINFCKMLPGQIHFLNCPFNFAGTLMGIFKSFRRVSVVSPARNGNQRCSHCGA